MSTLEKISEIAASEVRDLMAAASNKNGGYYKNLAATLEDCEYASSATAEENDAIYWQVQHSEPRGAVIQAAKLLKLRRRITK